MITGIQDVEQLCAICGYKCKNRRSLGNHLSKSHPEMESSRQYFDTYLLSDKILCKCGCGGETLWKITEYRYGDYINGHNPAGFKVKQPYFTDEQIHLRNKKIKAAYESHELRQKVSHAVREGLAQSDYDFSQERKKLWQNDDFRQKQHESRVESWSGIAGEERREKVFTTEFSRKISQANMKREARRISKSEEDFCQKLESFGERVVRSKWFNFHEKTWCADCYLPESRTIIEFDGVYWHGHDRSTNFTPKQLMSMTNDLKKNKIAREKGLNLIRIKESVVDRVNTFDDLIALAHHVVVRGEVIKEGTIRHADNDPIITRDTLLRLTLENNVNYIEKTYLKVLKDYLRSYVAYWDWFYPEKDEELVKILKQIGNIDKINQSVSGSSWLKKRTRSYWNVQDGPVGHFFNDKSLESVLKYRLGINNSKDYTYTLSDGTTYTGRETFDISLKEIRTGFIVQRMKVSWFKPAWAAAIYNRHILHVENPVVWDPSIGFSARLLGFSAVCRSGKYIGCEPASMTHADALAISQQINSVRPNIVFDLRKSGSENCEISDDSVDFVFTCPPYFNTEQYFNEEGQCWRDYPEKSMWLKKYLQPTCNTAYRALKPDCYAVFIVGKALEEDMISACIAAGFEFVSSESFIETHDHFRRVKVTSNTDGIKEKIVTFKKAYGQ